MNYRTFVIKQVVFRGWIFAVILFLFCSASGAAQDISEEFHALASEIKKIHFTCGAQAYALLEEMYDISEHHPDSLSRLPRCLYLESLINSSQARNDSSINIRIDRLLSLIDKERHPFEYALLHYSCAMNNTIKSNYAEAFASGLEALGVFKSLNDSLYIGKVLIELGGICNFIRSFKMAEDYLQEALSYVKSGHRDYYHIKINLASVMYFAGNKEEAVDSLLGLIHEIEQKEDVGLLVSSYMGLAVCYSSMKKHEKAYECYMTILELLRGIDNDKATLVLYNNLGVYYYNKRELEKARHYFDTTRMIGTKAKNSAILSTVYLALSQIYAYAEMTDSAYYYLEEYRKINDRTANNAKAIEVYQAYVSTLLESSQKELKIAEQEILLHNRRLTVTIILALAIILLGLLILIIFQQKRRQQELIREAENKDLAERLRNEQKIQQLQEEQLESKVREITSYSLLISGKNKALNQIAEITQQEDKSREEINGKINRIIQGTLSIEEEWDSFMIHFDKVHPSFFNKLKSHCSDLTKHNLHLCAYIRIGLSTKEIAQILNISAETSRTNRYRLKKKLNLGEEESLDDFLRNL